MRLMLANVRQPEAYKSQWLEEGFQRSSRFDDLLATGQPSFPNTGVSTPAVNIIETPEEFRLEMVAPGMKKESFKIEVKDAVLTIAYDHDDNRFGERQHWKYRAREYNYHSFTRSFGMPDTLQTDNIEATYSDGILNIRLPKKDQAKAKPSRRIDIL
jgi:HSP20 family protein